MFERVKTEKVYMKIVEQVRDLIRQRRLSPGDKLPSEQILAQSFGTSRPSLREALSALEILGIIESKGGKGNFIRDDPERSLYEQELRSLTQESNRFELLEARKVLEVEIARLAAKKGTDEDLEAIQGSLDKMKRVIDNAPKIIRLDREFHINIAKAAHNAILLSMVSYLATGLNEKLWINLKEKTSSGSGGKRKYLDETICELYRKYFDEHTGIFNAIKNKDAKGASEEMYSHLDGYEKDLFFQYKEESIWQAKENKYFAGVKMS